MYSPVQYLWPGLQIAWTEVLRTSWGQSQDWYMQLEACTHVNCDSCKTASNGRGFAKLWMWVAEGSKEKIGKKSKSAYARFSGWRCNKFIKTKQWAIQITV